MGILRVFLLLVFLLCARVPSSQSAISCDGIDDLLTTSAVWSDFISAPAATIMIWFTAPSSTAGSGGVCWPASTLIGDNNAYLSMNLHSDGAVDQACVMNYDGAETRVHTPRTVDVPTHLTLLHGGGTLSLYLNGVLVSSVASGNTANLSDVVNVCYETAALPALAVIDAVVLSNTALSLGEIAAVAGSRYSRLGKTLPTGQWLFDNCPPGASGNGVVFRDHSGNGRTITGNDGANNTGLTCQGSRVLARWGGIQ